MGIRSTLKFFFKTIDKVIYGNIQGIPILSYHSICDTKSAVSISRKDFDEQMNLLYIQGFKTLTNKDLLQITSNKSINKDKFVVITFDDGYKDFLEIAIPILKKYGFTATVFICPGLLGKQIKWSEKEPCFSIMNQDDLRRVLAEGFEIGNHTMNHTWLKKLTYSQLEKEINGATKFIEKEVGYKVEAICAPYGVLDAKATQFLSERSNEYIIYGGKEGVFKYNRDKKVLSRITIDEKMTISEFGSLMKFENRYFYFLRNIFGFLKKDLPFLFGIRVLKPARIVKDIGN